MSEISVLKNVRKDLNKMIKEYDNMLKEDGPDTENYYYDMGAVEALVRLSDHINIVINALNKK